MKNKFRSVLAVSVLDKPRGTVEKLEAHKKGILHRAFSVFLTDENGRMLIQKRAAGKYHSGGLWSNACCSHPGEDIVKDAGDRLFEELGIRTPLREIGSFIYRHRFDNGLIEYEYDHILLGSINSHDTLSVNPEEAEQVRFISLDELKTELEEKPEAFSVWFITAAPKVIEHLKSRTK